MNLCVRDVISFEGKRCRILRIHPPLDMAWLIEIENSHAWPLGIPLSQLADVRREANDVSTEVTLSVARKLKLETDYAFLQRVLNTKSDLFEASARRLHLLLCAEELGCTPRTLQKLLRRYWQRGLTKSALLSDFNRCGRREDGSTAGRGRRPRKNHRPIYQVVADDVPRFEEAIKYFFSDERLSFEIAYQWLCLNFYYYEDGNQSRCPLPQGEFPTLRQFSYYFKKRHTLDERVKRRYGDREYARTYQPRLSDTIADCEGVGHIFEIDASIADVLIVHSIHSGTIIGKATIYLIVDRKSRLIVGFYVGLETASWETAVEALVSLVECKKTLCERYGVKYDPADWPADGILPSKLLGDRGEMISRASTSVAQELGVTVSNTRACVPNSKPNVETRFKWFTVDLRSTTPGFEPPENLGKRRRKHYEKEACMTLYELVAQALHSIIKHNRQPLKGYERSSSEILRGVEPSPIQLWNDGALQTGILGRRFEEETVRLALLPRATAKLTHEGILFKDLNYVSHDPRLIRAFVKARNGREPILISYDRRCVDLVYVHFGKGVTIPAMLSPRHQSYRGLPLREVEVIRDLEKDQKPGYDYKRAQVAFDFGQRTNERVRMAERQRDELGALSVGARKKDTKAARADERRQQNIDRTARIVGQEGPHHQSRRAEISGLPIRKTSSVENTTQTAAQAARRRMANS